MIGYDNLLRRGVDRVAPRHPPLLLSVFFVEGCLIIVSLHNFIKVYNCHFSYNELIKSLTSLEIKHFHCQENVIKG